MNEPGQVGGVPDLVPLIRQRLAEDILPVGHDYWDVLDLVPPSAEGKGMLHDESARRLVRLIPFQNFIDVYSILAADIISQVMYKNLTKLGLHEDEDIQRWHEATVIQNREIVRGSVFPILAAMLDSEIMQPGPGA